MARLPLKVLLAVSSLLLVTGAETLKNCPAGNYECLEGTCIPNYWVCDGVTDCPYYDDEENCDYYTSYETTSETPYRTTNSVTKWPTVSTTPWPIITCTEPFEVVGGRCVLVEPFTEVNWMEARYLCQKFYADLVVLDSVNFFKDLVRYIGDKGLTNHDYWVGGTDEAEEQEWKWITGWSMLRGTPLWAIYGSGSSYSQEPRDSYGNNQDCAYLDKERFFYVDDDDCQAQKATICQLAPWTTQQQHTQNTTQENEKTKQDFIKMISQEHNSDSMHENSDEISKNSDNKKVENPVQKTDQQHRGTAVKRISDKERKPTLETVLKPKKSMPEIKAKHQEEAPAEPLHVQIVKDKKEIITTAQAENHHVHKVQAVHHHLLKVQAENQHA